MAEKEDWRLLDKDMAKLRNLELNPTDGREIIHHAPGLKKCYFCWDVVENTPHQRWYLPEDAAFCVCEGCLKDFGGLFCWKLLDGYDICWPDDRRRIE